MRSSPVKASLRRKGQPVSGKGHDLIRALEREWRDALCAKDMERLRALIHPAFVLIGTRETEPFTMDREEWLEAIQRHELLSIDLEITDATLLTRCWSAPSAPAGG